MVTDARLEALCTLMERLVSERIDLPPEARPMIGAFPYTVSLPSSRDNSNLSLELCSDPVGGSITMIRNGIPVKKWRFLWGDPA